VALLHAKTLTDEIAADVRIYGFEDIVHCAQYAGLYLCFMMLLRYLTGEFVYVISMHYLKTTLQCYSVADCAAFVLLCARLLYVCMGKLSHCDGATWNHGSYPIFDPITEKHGMTGAVVFGTLLSLFVTLIGALGVWAV